ncbi:HalOD1 output domain-containing protein [Natrialba taiwanensis]|uniref:HalOD1 output domain-containing protein n=1 Tax=Natrialba taiwanensis TaxID=160846 RepID=UPI000A00E24C|nr:HalOD1 output domain-containing protein [Natrialba taiwanensis]
MAHSNASLSTRVVFTVAEAIDTDPVDLPSLEKTISSEALNNLFHEDTSLPGAYLVFPYSDVWVIVHGDRTVDVFMEYAATTAVDDVPTDSEGQPTDDQMVVLSAENGRHAFTDDELKTLHEIVEEADDATEAWEDTINYAEQR